MMETTYEVTRNRMLLRYNIPTFAEAREYATGRFGIMMDANPGDTYLITKRDVLADLSVVYIQMGTIDSAGFHPRLSKRGEG